MLDDFISLVYCTTYGLSLSSASREGDSSGVSRRCSSQSIAVSLEVLPCHQQAGVSVHVFWSRLWSSFGTIFVFASKFSILAVGVQ